VKETKCQPSQHRGPTLLGICFRVLGAVIGGIFMFALWLMAVLVRMPHPPVPPSFAVSLTAPVVTAVGFALGMRVVERLTRWPRGTFRETYLCAWAGGTVGTIVMSPFGGMMAGFGLFGLGTATILVRELLLHRRKLIVYPRRSTESRKE
jgi:hypothetical protein